MAANEKVVRELHFWSRRRVYLNSLLSLFHAAVSLVSQFLPVRFCCYKPYLFIYFKNNFWEWKLHWKAMLWKEKNNFQPFAGKIHRNFNITIQIKYCLKWSLTRSLRSLVRFPILFNSGITIMSMMLIYWFIDNNVNKTPGAVYAGWVGVSISNV